MPFLHEDGKGSSRGVASDWVVSPGSQQIATSVSVDAKEGGFSQRVDVRAVMPDRTTPYVAFTQSQSRLRLKGATQYELAGWVKGRGTASLSVVVNDNESRTLGTKVVLTDTWQYVQMAFATPNRVRNVRELIRFGESGAVAGTAVSSKGTGSSSTA